MATSGKFQSMNNSKPLKKQVLLQALQFQFSCGTYPIVQISPLKVPPCIQNKLLVSKWLLLKISNFTCAVVEKMLK